MSAFLSRVDIIDDDETPHIPPVLKLTITEELELFDFSRELHREETLHGLRHESVTDKAAYLQEMISLLVRAIEADHDVEVDGSVLEPAEMQNLLNRYDKRGETE